MEKGPTITTERLVLRRWRDSDLEPFAALNSDPLAMEFFPKMLSRKESDDFASRIDAGYDDHAYGLWAVEVRGGQAFIGFVGLHYIAESQPCQGGVEVGWRLAREAWGRGYAPEAALASLQYGFGECGLREIVSFTSVLNERSQRVMQKIGMHRDLAGDFEHPRVAEGNRLRSHVLYRLTAEEWSERRDAQASTSVPDGGAPAESSSSSSS